MERSEQDIGSETALGSEGPIHQRCLTAKERQPRTVSKICDLRRLREDHLVGEGYFDYLSCRAGEIVDGLESGWTAWALPSAGAARRARVVPGEPGRVPRIHLEDRGEGRTENDWTLLPI